MPQSAEERLIIQGIPIGYTIWNPTVENRELIRNHSFWEIRGGDKVFFWEES